MDTHERYSVLITNTDGRRGSGTLYYTKGASNFYILTCAHVIYGASNVTIHILTESDNGDPKEYTVDASSEQFHYSPIDEVTKISDTESTHTCDIAIIECEKDKIPLKPTAYSMYPMINHEKVISVGYPQGDALEHLYYQQDSFHGQVQKVLKNQNHFVIRVTDNFLNFADRYEDLKGFSGAPVWDEMKVADNVYLFGGLTAFGVGRNISRGRVNVMSARALHTLMLQEFGINIESRLPSIPDEDIAPGYDDNKDSTDHKAVRDSWIENERQKARTYIDCLQLQKAIDVSKLAIDNREFGKCSDTQKISVYGIMLEAYRLAGDYENYDRVIGQMNAAGIHHNREALLGAVRYFEEGKFAKARECINKAIEINPSGNEECALNLALCSYEDKNAEVSILRSMLGDKDQLLIKPKSDQEEESIYQILGFILAERFKETGRAIRCLNRSFQIYGNYLVLETLAMTYYFHSIRNAFLCERSDKIDRNRIEHSEIEKSRDAYLRVISAADNLYFRGMVKRGGLQMFKCFYFIPDNFRIYKHYHDLATYYEFHNEEELRDVQLCYLEVAIKKEDVDLSEFQALTEFDRKFYELSMMMEKLMKQLESGLNTSHVITERVLQNCLSDAEKKLKELDRANADGCHSLNGIHSAFINLYRFGILLYKWQAISEVKRHISALQNIDDMTYFRLYVDELESNDFEKIEVKYKDLFNHKKDVASFNEWCRFYIRHRKFEKAKELFDSVFNQRNFLIEAQPEYFYREYIFFYLEHDYDLTAPIKCFVERNDEFKDIFLKLLFEIELNFATCTFNDPDNMLEIARELLDEGLILEADYREKCLIINMLNCRPFEAEKYANLEHEEKPDKATVYERILFVWKGHSVTPHPHWDAMYKRSIDELNITYANEIWARIPSVILNECATGTRRMIVVDLWSMYYLVRQGELELFDYFEKIYITHATISMALQEINNVNDINIRNILKIIQKVKNIEYKSPTLAEQLEIRDSSYQYMEIHNALLLAETMNCPAFVGEFRFPVQKRFYKRIIRPSSFLKVAKYMVNHAKP